MKFKELIETHIDSLWATALRLTKNSHDAEDLVQDTCLKAFENLDSLRDERKSKSWLFRILTNTFINKYRKDQRSPEEIEIESDFLEPIFYKSGQYIDPEGEIFSNILDEEVKDAIDGLPEDFRMAVLLVDIEGLTYQEVEDIILISPGTLASRLYRGRRLLRDSLCEHAKRKGFLRGGFRSKK